MEITIEELIELIVELTGFRGEIMWDTSKPNGQLRRSVNTNSAWQEFDFRTQTDFREGLCKTIDWYLAYKHQLKLKE